ncbi:MAG: alpha/beta hydrolase [Acidobacteriaceae bacterium]|nr:alpha/beta hydrolase [Acidobacteriaceae bacterium]
MPPVTASNFKLHKQFKSRFGIDRRDVIVCLPPGYESSPERRYPVLYLHDGQNLFDPATAFAGNDWGLGPLALDLFSRGEIEPLIMVGIYNAGQKRIDEYTPVRDRRGRGGRARAYGKLIVDELKPFIDAQYRTLPEMHNTGLGGSSLGALVTLYLGLQYPHVFGKLIVMSPSVWWANRAIVKEVRKLRHKLGEKIWLDIGTREGERPEVTLKYTLELKDALIEKGWKEGEDLAFMLDEGAGHNEKAWGHRMRDALKFLFPAVSE